MKRRPDVSLVLPCYNEEGLFRDSIARIREVLRTSKLSYEVILVDDASRDATPDLISAACSRYRTFRCIRHDRNTGRGQAVSDGIRDAQGTVVGYIDIDCEVDPVYIPDMVRTILQKQADVVIGKRYYRTSPQSVIREILSRGYQRLADSMVGTGGLDTETGYKFFSRRKILNILPRVRHRGWFWDTEIMVYARRAGLKIVEHPVLFLRRFDKQSSVHVVRDTIDYLVHLWGLRRALAGQHLP